MDEKDSNENRPVSRRNFFPFAKAGAGIQFCGENPRASDGLCSPEPPSLKGTGSMFRTCVRRLVGT